MKIVAAVALAVLVVSPAAAEPIPAPQAVTELTTAIDATNNADSYTYADALMGWTAAFSRSGGQYEQNTDTAMKAFSTTGTYWAVQWPSARIRAKVRSARYLNNPALQWELVTSRIGEIPLWADLLDPRGERRGLIYFPPQESDITYADRTALPGATRYTIGNGFFEEIYTVDVAGRVTQLENTRAAGSPVTGHVRTWVYAPVSVTAPEAATALPYATVQRAIEAASLDTTLRGLARDIAAQRRSLARMRVAAREKVVIYNAGGEDEQVPIFVKLRIRNVPGGVRIFRTNPITGTFHQWRVTQRDGGYRAARTAP